MQINVRHNSNSVREFGRISTPWWRRGLRMLRNVRVVVYLGIGLFLAGKEIYAGLSSSPANTDRVGKGLLIALVVLVILGFLFWRQQAAVNKVLRDQGDQQMEFSAAGLTTTKLDGTHVFEPWSAFQSFQDGKHLIVLTPRQKGTLRAIPTGELSPEQVGQLRSILLSNIAGPRMG